MITSKIVLFTQNYPLVHACIVLQSVFTVLQFIVRRVRAFQVKPPPEQCSEQFICHQPVSSYQPLIKSPFRCAPEEWKRDVQNAFGHFTRMDKKFSNFDKIRLGTFALLLKFQEYNFFHTNFWKNLLVFYSWFPS